MVKQQAQPSKEEVTDLTIISCRKEDGSSVQTGEEVKEKEIKSEILDCAATIQHESPEPKEEEVKMNSQGEKEKKGNDRKLQLKKQIAAKLEVTDMMSPPNEKIYGSTHCDWHSLLSGINRDHVTTKIFTRLDLDSARQLARIGYLAHILPRKSTREIRRSLTLERMLNSRFRGSNPQPPFGPGIRLVKTIEFTVDYPCGEILSVSAADDGAKGFLIRISKDGALIMFGGETNDSYIRGSASKLFHVLAAPRVFMWSCSRHALVRKEKSLVKFRFRLPGDPVQHWESMKMTMTSEGKHQLVHVVKTAPCLTAFIVDDFVKSLDDHGDRDGDINVPIRWQIPMPVSGGTERLDLEQGERMIVVARRTIGKATVTITGYSVQTGKTLKSVTVSKKHINNWLKIDVVHGYTVVYRIWNECVAALDLDTGRTLWTKHQHPGTRPFCFAKRIKAKDDLLGLCQIESGGRICVEIIKLNTGTVQARFGSILGACELLMSRGRRRTYGDLVWPTRNVLMMKIEDHETNCLIDYKQLCFLRHPTAPGFSLSRAFKGFGLVEGREEDNWMWTVGPRREIYIFESYVR